MFVWLKKVIWPSLMSTEWENILRINGSASKMKHKQLIVNTRIYYTTMRNGGKLRKGSGRK